MKHIAELLVKEGKKHGWPNNWSQLPGYIVKATLICRTEFNILDPDKINEIFDIVDELLKGEK